MKNKTRVLYAILSLIVASLACGENTNPPVIEKGKVSCARRRDDTVQVFIGDMEYNCSCPTAPKIYEIYLRSQIEGKTAEELEGIFCASSSSSNDAAATEPPTEEPAPTEPPTEEPLKPYLAGTVTACDAYLRYVNFPVNPDAPAGPPNVIFSGTTVNCSLVNNGTILSCNYPEGLPFPFQVVALINNQPVNNFAFDGAICTTAAPQGPQGAQGSEGSVGDPGSAACDPNQPGTPCFCVLNPSDESCNK